MSNHLNTAHREAVLCTQTIDKVYRTGEVEIHALRGVSVEFYESEFVVLLGASGSGKSTLLNIIGGLDTPSSGKVFYKQEELTKYSMNKLTLFRREHVGFVFQFYNLIPSLTALENVSLVTEIAQAPMNPKDALALVGLQDRMEHFPAQLSGGEQQRVAIARAISKKPSILLCDEPTGALDSQTGTMVLEAIDTVNREVGTTTILITHNAVVGDMADRSISLTDGMVSSIVENETRQSARDLKW
jgi:putative ABC transport system ATP-binding protein